MALARVSPSSLANLIPPLLQSFFRPFSSDFPIRNSRRRSSPVAAAFSLTSQSAHAAREGLVMEAPRPSSRYPWKPTCLYYTQGKCTMMNDAMHLEKFSHNLKMDLPVNASATDKSKPQKLEYLLILDLEGRVEILEFPVMMIDAQNREFVDSFHRFVRPTAMSEQRTTEYIEGKYGKFGVDRVWHDTATPFKQVLQEFEDWLGNHNLWKKEQVETGI
uniref:Exonuclease domain-containing protein n=1 Tax=Zea mays TaxID=4577 RepID=A0A804PX63_MAIZE